MVYVIVLNWNGAADTIACAESVLALDGTPFQLVICDNASADDSVTRLRAWAAGRADDSAPVPVEPELTERAGARPPRPMLELANDRTAWQHPSPAPGTVVLIQTGSNLGYAGGNNVGIRYSLERGDADFFWILNNDTAVAPSALSALLVKANSDPRYGIVGSTLLYHYRPDYVQVLGGCRFSAWTTSITPVGWGKTAVEAKEISESEVESQLDYVSGASMLVSKAFVADVGLMQEDYFLYYEEIDWAERGRRSETHSWKLGFARDSVVFHKVGASAGTGSTKSAIRYIYTSKIRFMKRFYPARHSITLLMVFMQAVKSMFTNGPDHTLVILTVLIISQRTTSTTKRKSPVDAN